MNFVQIATSVVSLLVPYLAKAGESAAQKAGESAWEKAKAIHEAIVNKFSEDEYAKQTLERLEEKPSTESRQRVLIDVLSEKAEADPGFAKELNRLVNDISSEKSVSQSQTQVSHGDNNKNVNVGGNVENLNFR